jgi:hypothetical protein
MALRGKLAKGRLALRESCVMLRIPDIVWARKEQCRQACDGELHAGQLVEVIDAGTPVDQRRAGNRPRLQSGPKDLE